MAIRIPIAALLSLLVLTAPAWAAFPGRNGAIAFSSNRDFPLPFSIYSMNPDGSGVSQLTSPPHDDGEYGGPVWSPDGNQIVFTRRLDNQGSPQIWTMDVDGSDQRRLTFTAPFEFERNPEWSPDGSKIIFERFVHFTQKLNLYVMNSDGTGVQQLTDGASNADPAWSPDGTRIAFTRLDGADTTDIYVMNADGTGAVNITNKPGFSDGTPDWSPDGSRIAFHSDRDTTFCCPPNIDIYTMNADGSGVTRLTDHPQEGFSPAWSPDGTQIAFTNDPREGDPDGGPEIYVMNADGSDEHNISNTRHHDANPSWQPLQNRSPDCSSVTATPTQLSPPNHRLAPVRLEGAIDTDGDVASLTITGVTQDEPVGDAADAVSGTALDQVRLRAERDGTGDGRVYRISFEGNDGHGGSCAGTTVVRVKKGARPAVDSAPPSFDSFG